MAAMKTDSENNNSFKVWIILIPIVVALAACSPASPPEMCAEFNSVIDHNIMVIALSEVEGETSDKSAMQQGARLAQNNNRLSTIMLNIQLQAQNKCQPRQKPIDTSIYASQAQECYLARLKQMSATYGTDEDKKTASKAASLLACDFKAWNTKKNK
jgi:hypothetical protein